MTSVSRYDFPICGTKYMDKDECIRKHFLERESVTTVHFYSQFDGAYLPTGVILEISFWWISLANRLATMSKFPCLVR